MSPGTEHSDAQHLHRHLDALQSRLPGWGAVWLQRLRQPKARWVRIPVGVLLIFCGFLGFLPVLGFWMLPLGVLLLALDVPLLRAPTVRAVDWLVERWEGWQRRRGSR